MNLTLSQIRTLVTKIIVNQAFGDPLGEADYDRLRAEAIDLVVREANATLRSSSSERLDAYVPRVAAYAKNTLHNMPSVSVDARGNTAIRKFERTASQFDCTRCALDAGGHICDGTADDDQTVSDGGRCLKSVRDIMDAAVQTAIAYYRAYSPEFCSLGPEPSITWATSYHAPDVQGRDRPHSIPVPVYAGGSTRFLDKTGTAAAEITLQFALDKFDLNSWQTLPYIALHETVCHAFHGLTTIVGSRTGEPKFDMFAEGWVDSLIGDILQDFRNDTGPASQHRRMLGQDHHIKRGIEMQCARANQSRCDAALYADHVARSATVSEAIRSSLCARLGVSEGVVAFRQLTFDLNLLLGSLEFRRKFVNQLLLSLGRRDARNSKVKRAVEDFANNRCPRNFLITLMGPIEEFSTLR